MRGKLRQTLRSLTLISISTLLAILSSASTLAMKNEEFFSLNNIPPFYRSDICSPEDTSTTPTANTGSGTVGAFKNPVITSNAPDPSVIRGEDGKFYLYATGFQQFVSDDMVNWKKLNDGIKWIKNNPGWSTDRWAPDIAKVGDTYVLSISGRSSGNRTIGYATSKSAAGPFTYQGQLVNSADRGKYGWGYDIDPNIVQTDKGIFLYYGSGRDYIKVAKLTQNGDKLSAGRSKTVFTTKYGEAPVKAEGAFVHKHGDYYYLYFSSGDYKISGGAPYRLRVARSKNPDKGFVEQKQPILEGNSSFTHPGHNSVITDASGSDFLVYHAYKKGTSDRATLIDKITYENDWPVINKKKGPSSGQQVGSTGGPSTASASGGQVNITIAHANIQTQNGPDANYSKNQRDRFIGTVDKFNSDSPDFITLNEISPETNTNYKEYKSFKQKYPSAKTSEDSALRILWNTDRWKKIDGGITLIHEYETDPAKQIGKPMNWKDRYALWATFQNIQNGASTSVIATHWNTSATAHKARAKTQGNNLKKLAQELLPKGPVVIGGDFNFQIGSAGEPHSPATILGEAGMKPVFKKGDGSSVDWLFYSEQLKLSGKKVVKKDTSLSDHPYLVGKFQGSGGDTTKAQVAACCADPEIGSTNTTTETQLQGNDNTENVWNYLINQVGLSEIQAAGVMGNIKQESGFDPKIVNKTSGAYGLIQWLGGRKTNLEKFANAEGKEMSDIGVQLKFMKKELESSYNSSVLTPLKAATTIKEATNVWLRHYEIPCVGSTKESCFAGELAKRLPNSQGYYEKYTGKTASDTPIESTGGGSCANTGSDSEGSGDASEFSVDGMTIYNQEDPRWASNVYGYGADGSVRTIKTSGCGPSSMATIITALTKKKVTPADTTEFAKSKNLYVPGAGSSHQISPVLAEHWNLKAKKISADAPSINKELRNGALIITSGTGAAPFTSAGHIITIRGVTESGKWMIADSNGSRGQENSKKEWNPRVILGIANSGNVWAISK